MIVANFSAPANSSFRLVVLKGLLLLSVNTLEVAYLHGTVRGVLGKQLGQFG